VPLDQSAKTDTPRFSATGGNFTSNQSKENNTQSACRRATKAKERRRFARA
jgi:hypothetical protein